MTVKLRVTYPSLACGATFTWSSIAYAGNSFGQETFAPVIGAGTAGVTNMPTNAIQTVGCGYKVEITPTSVAKGSSPTLNAKVTNASSTTITSVTINPPASGGITTTTTNFTQNIGATPVDISLPARVACNAAGGQWSTSVTPSGFTKTVADTTTTTYGACSLAFSSLPPSIVTGEPFNVVVKLVDGDGATIPGFGGTVTLVATGTGCTLSETGTQTNANGVVTINGVELALTNATSCVLRATATFDSESFVKDSSALKVFNGVLGCVPGLPFSALDLPTSGTGTFVEPRSGAANSGQTAFIGGARGPGDVENGATCTGHQLRHRQQHPDDHFVLPRRHEWQLRPGRRVELHLDESIAPNPVIGVITTYRSGGATR